MASSPTRHRQRLPDARGAHLAGRCDSQKVCFANKPAALDAAERLMQEGRVTPGCHITPYLCERCHYWHVRNKRIVPC